MWWSGTLSYPWIMLDRQIQLIERCTKDTTTFEAVPFHFIISVPPALCILPHRIFPEDTSIQVVPKSYYSVWNEYAKGTIIESSRATFLFEPLTTERNASKIWGALDAGGFLAYASTTTYTTTNGIGVIEVIKASGIEEGKFFDWAFIDHPNGQTTLSILAPHTSDGAVFHELINALRLSSND